MSSALLRELSCLEQALASRPLSAAQRRRLRPLLRLLMARLATRLRRQAH